jgi:hypothetical protein
MVGGFGRLDNIIPNARLALVTTCSLHQATSSSVKSREAACCQGQLLTANIALHAALAQAVL